MVMLYAMRVLWWAILLFVVDIPAEATPFQLIVPSAVTLNTSGGVGASGEVFTTWLAATDTPIVFAAPSNEEIAPGTFGSFTSDNSNVTPGGFILLVWPTVTALMPGQVDSPTTASTTNETGIELLGDQLLASESIVLTQDVGLQFAESIGWATGYTGSATLDFTFAIGQDVAQYSIFATFVDLPTYSPVVEITSAQTVTSVFDPTFQGAPSIPEPATAALFGIGLAGLGFSRRQKA